MKILLLLLFIIAVNCYIKSISKKNLYNVHNSDQIDGEFINGIGIVILTIPMMFKKEEQCKIDNDCPSIMRCCQIGKTNFCCNPNSYVKIETSYVNEYLKINDN